VVKNLDLILAEEPRLVKKYPCGCVLKIYENAMHYDFCEEHLPEGLKKKIA